MSNATIYLTRPAACLYWSDRVSFPRKCGRCEKCVATKRKIWVERAFSTKYDLELVFLGYKEEERLLFLEPYNIANLLRLFRLFRKEAKDTMGKPWEYFAIPEIQPTDEECIYNCHIHVLIRGLKERDLPEIRRRWKKIANNRVEHIPIRSHTHHRNAMEYVVEKKYQYWLPKYKRDYSASENFFDVRASFKRSRLHDEALKRLFEGFKALLPPKRALPLNYIDIADQIGLAHSSIKGKRFPNRIATLEKWGVIKVDRKKKPHRYTLLDPAGHDPEFKRILGVK